MKFSETISYLKKRLSQPLPGADAHEKMAARVLPLPSEIPHDAKPSAVLCLLFPKEEETHLLLIKRTEDGRAHSGQISFPGGKQDEQDADLGATALREANEEVGIASSEVTIMGALTRLYIPVSNFQVYPFIAYTHHQTTYRINKYEVADVLEIPLREFLNAERKLVVDVTSSVHPDPIRKVKAYRLEDGSVIWGATAMIISELEALMQETRVF